MKVNLNQFIRGLGLLFFMICIKKIKSWIKLISLFIWLSISFLIHLSYGMSTNSFTDIAFILKVFENFVFFYSFSELIKIYKIQFNEIAQWLVYSSYIVIASILLSYAGIGMESYISSSGRGGVKGFFTIQSTITAYLLLIMPLYYYQFKKLISWQMLLCVISLMSIGSKTGVLGTLLVFICLLVFDVRSNYINGKLKKKTLVTFLAVVGGGASIGVIALQKYILQLINLYRTKEYYYSLDAFLLSNRNDQISAIQRYISDWNSDWEMILGNIFGYGYSGAAKMMQVYNSAIKAIERDFHGIYYYFGFVVLILIFLLCGKVMWDTFWVNKKNDFRRLEYYLCILILGIGIVYGWLGGHIFYEAMNHIPFWLIGAYIYVEKSCIVTKKS